MPGVRRDQKIIGPDGLALGQQCATDFCVILSGGAWKIIGLEKFQQAGQGLLIPGVKFSVLDREPELCQRDRR